jgi:hypothetical protein
MQIARLSEAMIVARTMMMRRLAGPRRELPSPTESETKIFLAAKH